MNQAGSLALIVALAFAAYAVIAGAVSGKLRSMRALRSAERATLAFAVMSRSAMDRARTCPSGSKRYKAARSRRR